MVKKHKKCWNCGKDTMEPFDQAGHGWLKCSSCGATHMPNPTTLGAETLFAEKVAKGERETKYRPGKERLPKQTIPV